MPDRRLATPFSESSHSTTPWRLWSAVDDGPPEQVVRVLVVSGDSIRVEGALATVFERVANRELMSRVVEVVPCRFERTQSPCGLFELTRVLERLDPKWVIDLTYSHVEAARCLWRDVTRPLAKPIPWTIVRFESEAETHDDDVHTPSPGLTPTGEASRLIAHARRRGILVETGSSSSALTILYDWLELAAGRADLETDILARIHRIAFSKARATRSRPGHPGALERLARDLESRLSLLNACRRLQALDEYRRHRFFETSMREVGPLSTLASLVGDLDRDDRGVPASPGGVLAKSLDMVRASMARLDALNERLRPKMACRGARLAGGSLVGEVQDRLRGETRYLDEVRRQAHVVFAVGEKLARDRGLNCAEGFHTAVERLIFLERTCGFGATEKALNALTAHRSRPYAFPRVVARFAWRGVGNEPARFLAFGLVPFFAGEEIAVALLGRGAKTASIPLPPFFLGRVDIEVPDGVVLEKLELVPSTGIAFERDGDALERRPDGTLSTGLVFLGA